MAAHTAPLIDLSRVVASAGGDVSITNTSSSAMADTAMTITCPNVAGKTYTVVVFLPSGRIADAANVLVLGLEGPTLGAGTQMGRGSPGVVNEGFFLGSISRGGFSPNEAATVQWLSNANTKTVAMDGGWSMLVYEDA